MASYVHLTTAGLRGSAQYETETISIPFAVPIPIKSFIAPAHSPASLAGADLVLVLAAAVAVSFRAAKLGRIWRSHKAIRQSNLIEKAQKRLHINRGVRFFDHDDGSHCLPGGGIIRRNISRISSYGGVAANAGFNANLAIM
jgi:hypothetical protein